MALKKKHMKLWWQSHRLYWGAAVEEIDLIKIYTYMKISNSAKKEQNEETLKGKTCKNTRMYKITILSNLFSGKRMLKTQSRN